METSSVPLGRAANHAESVVTLRPPIFAPLPGASVSLAVICSPASSVAGGLEPGDVYEHVVRSADDAMYADKSRRRRDSRR